MKLKVKGKSYIYTHKCNLSEHGRPLTRSEMQEFVTECLIKSYEMLGYECIRHTPDFNSDADFSYNKLGKTICGVVKYGLSKNEVSELIAIMYNDAKFKKTFPQLYKGFHEYNSYPVFYFSEAKCLDTDDGNPIAGGQFEIQWSPIQALHLNIPTSGPNISEFEMYKGYARSWETGDISFIRDYVSSYFSGVSELSFECTTSKAELIELIKSQHDNWKTRQITIRTDLIKDKDSGDKGILMVLNGRPTGFVVLRFSNYRISQSETRMPPQNYEDWESGYELYQTHGDHHAPFVNDEELPLFLKDVLEKSSVHLFLDTTVSFDDVETHTRVASLKYPTDKYLPDIAYLALIAYNPAEEVNEFVTCYPYLKGKPTEVEVIDVLEWSNQIEATIKCKYCPEDEDDNEFVFHFFATDYFFNKNRYKIGEKISIALAASSGNAKEASRGFTFEGQKALDFLAKIGKEPTYDKNGDIEPVNFSTEQLVAFLPHDSKCPDMAEFQSPTKDLFHDYFYNNSVNRCIIKLNGDTGLEIPMYFNDDIAPQNGDPICGWLWLSGRLSDPCVTKGKHFITKMANDLMLSDISERFLSAINKLKYRSVIDLSPILHTLPDVSIPAGKSLFAIRLGNSSRYSYELFHANFSELIGLQDYINLNGFIDGTDEDKVASYMFNTQSDLNGSSQSAVWQAFLLSIMGKFMPYNKTYSSEFSYILTQEDAEKSSKAMNGKIPAFKLLPTFSNDKCNSGYFSVLVWDAGELYRQVYTYTITNGKIRFLLDESYLELDTIDYFSDESDLRFRDGK